ncbi:hypothetical protein KIPB_003947, partial [Kipferlia bialata]
GGVGCLERTLPETCPLTSPTHMALSGAGVVIASPTGVCLVPTQAILSNLSSTDPCLSPAWHSNWVVEDAGLVCPTLLSVCVAPDPTPCAYGIIAHGQEGDYGVCVVKARPGMHPVTLFSVRCPSRPVCGAVTPDTAVVCDGGGTIFSFLPALASAVPATAARPVQSLPSGVFRGRLWSEERARRLGSDARYLAPHRVCILPDIQCFMVVSVGCTLHAFDAACIPLATCCAEAPDPAPAIVIPRLLGGSPVPSALLGTGRTATLLLERYPPLLIRFPQHMCSGGTLGLRLRSLSPTHALPLAALCTKQTLLAVLSRSLSVASPIPAEPRRVYTAGRDPTDVLIDDILGDLPMTTAEKLILDRWDSPSLPDPANQRVRVLCRLLGYIGTGQDGARAVAVRLVHLLIASDELELALSVGRAFQTGLSAVAARAWGTGSRAVLSSALRDMGDDVLLTQGDTDGGASLVQAAEGALAEAEAEDAEGLEEAYILLGAFHEVQGSMDTAREMYARASLNESLPDNVGM